ncbi:MAG TPA: permease [Cryomorphaceae bacterium]|jgi:uncharacterized protein|nr:MAG: permease [Cryomorphaceae bacterium BACL7 MAG-120910-bin2]KRO68356.1 MAG: permease [Cryomorphaceae bacterium BACL7 MAG-120322-bin74]KRO83553.1 MAG: permease [Cryomorphaceae bacterium BACL7 MAG-121220-bin83]NQW25429.1 sulfite exporter TauE/SafE family protein [Cryomorphaceae bacterium]HAB31289.1 permease [Cryomorphaceae bacterium]
MLILAYLASLLIGLSLGILGGGGSILTLPVLVYLFGIDATMATAYSLFIVGATSLASIIPKARQGEVDFGTALYFGAPAVVAVYMTRAFIVPMIPDEIVTFSSGHVLSRDTFLMLLFATLMLLAARGMIVGKKAAAPATAIPLGKKVAIILAEGIIVGVLTGLVGAGGGFLIIPALVLVTGLDMKTAIGTSLTIIAFKSLLGFTGDLGHHTMDWNLLTLVTLVAIVGMVIGTFVSKKIDSHRLQKAFGWFVLIMGIFIVGKELL